MMMFFYQLCDFDLFIAETLVGLAFHQKRVKSVGFNLELMMNESYFYTA